MYMKVVNIDRPSYVGTRVKVRKKDIMFKKVSAIDSMIYSVM